MPISPFLLVIDFNPPSPCGEGHDAYLPVLTRD